MSVSQSVTELAKIIKKFNDDNPKYDGMAHLQIYDDESVAVYFYDEVAEQEIYIKEFAEILEKYEKKEN